MAWVDFRNGILLFDSAAAAAAGGGDYPETKDTDPSGWLLAIDAEKKTLEKISPFSQRIIIFIASTCNMTSPSTMINEAST
uniref:DUF1618 domain-containing protein n=1 Tax=Oryza punctata TaxID=4537 RepID=A0A0E0KPU6_ORYPU